MSIFAVAFVAVAVAANAYMSAPAPTPVAKTAVSQPAALTEAVALEESQKLPEAVKKYREAANAGSGAAAKRLYEIHMKGGTGVERDMAEARRWLYVAQVRGEDVPVAKRLRVTEEGHVQMY